MFNKFRSRGFAAGAALCLALVGGSTEAFGQVAAVSPTVPTAATSSLSAALGLGTPQPAAPVVTPAPRPLTLGEMVSAYHASEALDDEQNCLATAVYHEARGETLEGQLAVARVIINRAASGRYPTTMCGVVKQPWQFSFVNPHSGRMPGVDAASDSWRKAKAIAEIAVKNAAASVSTDVLWYHADYVAPSWGRRLTRANKIGAHIFYRA